MGYAHGCGIDGTAVRCWGSNDVGQIGTALGGNATVPTLVDAASGLTKIASSARTTCGIDGSGALRCWGDNTSGEMGTGGALVSKVPVTVVDANGWQAIAGNGVAFCGIKNGALYCWGQNQSGALGEQGTVPEPVKSHGSEH